MIANIFLLLKLSSKTHIFLLKLSSKTHLNAPNCVLIPVATSYLCETVFSAMAVLKTKYCSKLDVKREMRVAVSNIAPQFEVLCQNKRANDRIKFNCITMCETFVKLYVI